MSINVDHKRKLIFVHNPKCAGTSLRSYLGLPKGPASHALPHKMVSKLVWEEYTSIVCVRNPFSRLISSYFYHTNKRYKGGYYSKYPDIHNWELEKYFYELKDSVLILQTNYTRHIASEKEADIIIKFEELSDANTIIKLRPYANSTDIPNHNQSTIKVNDYREYFYNQRLLDEVKSYYLEDLANFNYTY